MPLSLWNKCINQSISMDFVIHKIIFVAYILGKFFFSVIPVTKLYMIYIMLLKYLYKPILHDTPYIQNEDNKL